MFINTPLVLRIIPSKLLGFLLATIFRIYGIFNSGVDGGTSKDELLHGEERPLGMAMSSSSLFFVSRSVEGGTLGWGGLDFCLRIGDSLWVWCFLSLFDMGCNRGLFLWSGTRVLPRLRLVFGIHIFYFLPLLLFGGGTDDRVHCVPPRFAEVW